jgi:predicted peptidase
MTPSGIHYNLYIPEGLDRDDAEPSVPLIVVFHGSTEKAVVKDRYGRLFTNKAVQEKLGKNGAAVLAVQSRVEYYSDPHAYARLIKNVLQQHRCIDGRRIAGYGFSQGAAFVIELAMHDPGLFKAVAAGSSYYSASVPELFRAARVRFYYATSRNDAGIYEQGHRTGQILAAICPDSRYVEYERRGHFFIEPKDSSGRGEETFLDWLARALAP